MTIELKPEAEAIIRKRLQSGAFASPKEVIERALELLSVEEEWLAENHDEIAAKVQDGWDAAQKGELIDLTQVRANLQKKKEEWLPQRHQP
jgi:antitoxin ParD1/3/4